VEGKQFQTKEGARVDEKQHLLNPLLEFLNDCEDVAEKVL